MRTRMKACGLWLLAALVVASCSDDSPPTPEKPQGLSSCLESPTQLVRPPSGQLPCELLPPGFGQ
jgi:hypothetical protein